MMENNVFLIKKVHIKTQSEKKDVLVIFILLQERIPKELKEEFLFIRQKLYSREHQMPYST